MGKAQTIRLATALTVIGVGVPLTVIANSRATSAGTNLSGAAAQVGSQAGTATGTTTKAATAGTSSGTTSTSASGSGTTTNYPADKMTVSGSTIAVSDPNQDVVLLSAHMRTSNVADLAFSVSSECSIVTDVTTTGNDMQSAFGQIRMWVTIDGKDVGVVPGTQGTSDDGHVVFCNQAYSSTTKGFTADPNASIETYLETKHANAFNWVAMNVGNSVHLIELHGELTQTHTANGKAQMVVGSRTLMVNVTTNAQDGS